MRNNTPVDYAVKRRFSGETTGLKVEVAGQQNFLQQQPQIQGLVLPIRANPEYYASQHSERKVPPEQQP